MSENVQHYDVIIYGMGLQGLAAATQLMKNCPEKTMLLISPVDGVYPGTIATIGGQNYWDCRLLNNVSVHEKKESCQGGFFKYLFYPYKKYYNNIMMYDESYQLLLYLNFYNTLSKLGPAFHFNYNSDIVAVEKKDGRIESITVNHFERDDENMLRYISDTGYKVKGDIFIDASEDGKLARLADGAVTTGRYDWPEYLLDDVEKRSNGVGRQQAATLMVKVKGVNPFVAQSGVEKNFRTIFDQSSDGAWGADGEAGNYSRADSKVKLFNDTYGEQYGYAFKPFNAAQNGPQEDKAEADKEWWVNALMIFNVDGRAHERDRGLSCFPEYMIPGSKTTDQAYLDAREFLKGEGRTAFLDALHEWPGFEEAEFVIEGNQYSPFYNYPVTGDILYLRETVHMSTYTNNPDNDGEADYYQVPYWRSLGAGPDSSSGNDADCYNHRIGLVWYNPDIHPYKFSDLKNDEGEYIWWMDSYRHMRPDLVEEGYLPFENDAVPVNPMYFPYEGLLAHSVSNLLIPGYACGCCSVSWGEVRVLSNLCVLGDAAGIAAAYCFYNNKQPKSLTDYDIKMIQNQLRTMKTYGDDMKFAAILEKTRDWASYNSKTNGLNPAGGYQAGQEAIARVGGAVGLQAAAGDGGAVGSYAVSGDGFAGGKNAKTVNAQNNSIDAVQLGTGTNSASKTLQVYSKRIVEADGSLTDVGRLNALATTQKGNIVSAINELRDSIGGGGSGAATVVIGTSTQGHTPADCDYLCDGTDDQEEIQQAISSLWRHGGKIFILEGCYYLSGSVNIYPSNITIEGCGSGTHLVRMYDSADERSAMLSLWGAYNFIKIKNLFIDGNKSNYSGEYNTGIYFESGKHCEIANNFIINCTKNGIRIDQDYNNVHDNYIDGCNIAIDAHRFQNGRICGNITNNTASAGISLQGSYNNVYGNTTNRSKKSIYVKGNCNTISGNNMGDISDGMYLEDADFNTITGNCMHDITGQNYEVIHLSASNNNTIEGNVFDSIYIYSSSSHNIVLGNQYSYLSDSGTDSVVEHNIDY